MAGGWWDAVRNAFGLQCGSAMFRVNVIRHGVAGPGRTRSERDTMAGSKIHIDYRGLVIHVTVDVDSRHPNRLANACHVQQFVRQPFSKR